VLAVVLGLALEWLLFRHFYQRDHLDQVLLTYGLILVFEELRSLLWGDDVHGVPIPDLLAGLDPADRKPVLSRCTGCSCPACACCWRWACTC
jgi:branched-subunit amino acid ABC-type transport system permease component